MDGISLLAASLRAHLSPSLSGPLPPYLMPKMMRARGNESHARSKTRAFIVEEHSPSRFDVGDDPGHSHGQIFGLMADGVFQAFRQRVVDHLEAVPAPIDVKTQRGRGYRPPIVVAA